MAWADLSMIEKLERVKFLRELLEKIMDSASDSDALDGLELNKVWKPNMECVRGKRLRHGDKLFRVEQTHISSEIYPPGAIGTEALYSEVEKPGQGDDPSNPIPYNNNMELFEGKYYSQDGSVYYCFRSTGVAVYNPLSALVGIYVNLVS